MPASSFEISTFAKETKLLSEIRCSNVVKFYAVCENPIAVMLEYCEFSFRPFDREFAPNTLQQFLHYIDNEDLVYFFPGIVMDIMKDVTGALQFMHANSMVHTDIKPANVLVTNVHYLNLGDKERKEAYNHKRIICKLADLGEARSKLCQTKALAGNNRTKKLHRGSTAFMAPEISVPEIMLRSANLEQLKLIDMWALLMTMFVCLNPDQGYPFQNNTKVAMEKRSEEMQDCDELFKIQLRARRLPSPSKKYIQIRACYYQNLRDISTFTSSMMQKKDATLIPC
eukprot:gene19450-21376_t